LFGHAPERSRGSGAPTLSLHRDALSVPPGPAGSGATAGQGRMEMKGKPGVGSTTERDPARTGQGAGQRGTVRNGGPGSSTKQQGMKKEDGA